MEKIGIIWEQGEGLISGGKHLDGLIMFQRAKTLLIAESKELYNNPTSNNLRASKIFGDIMTKLNASIEKNVNKLSTCPELTLNLSKGFTKKDVKQAYRKYALKYHPDKNQDCDSSAVFTIVQSAYEKLLPLAPEATFTPMENRPNNHPAKSSIFASNTPKPTVFTTEKETTTAANKAANNNLSKPSSSSSSQRRRSYNNQTFQDHMNKKEDPTDKAYRMAGRERKEKNSNSSSSDSNIASNVSKLSTDLLRENLKKFGFLNVELMSREELVKKYLAVLAHNGCSSINSFESIWTEDWREALREEKNREREMFNESSNSQEDSKSSSSSSSSSKHYTSYKYYEKSDDQLREENRRADAADQSRKERAVSLASQIENMKIHELRKLLDFSGIDYSNCVERSELVEKLSLYYGIPVITTTTTSSQKIPQKSNHNKEPMKSFPTTSETSFDKNAIDMKNNRDDHSLNSNKYSNSKMNPNPPSNPPKFYHAVSENPPEPPNRRISSDKDVERLRRNVIPGELFPPNVNFSVDPNPNISPNSEPQKKKKTQSANILTKEKLKAFEKKLFGRNYPSRDHMFKQQDNNSSNGINDNKLSYKFGKIQSRRAVNDEETKEIILDQFSNIKISQGFGEILSEDEDDNDDDSDDFKTERDLELSGDFKKFFKGFNQNYSNDLKNVNKTSADTDYSYRFGTGLIFENDSDDLETNSDEV